MTPSRLLLAALLAAPVAFSATAAAAFPDNAAARLDERLTPRFGKLLKPQVGSHRPHSPRWRYGRWWNPIWRNGRWCYEYEFDSAYRNVVDQYGAYDQYPADPYGGGYPQGAYPGGYGAGGGGGGYEPYPGTAQGGYGGGSYPTGGYPSSGYPVSGYPATSYPSVVGGGAIYDAQPSVYIQLEDTATADCSRRSKSDTPIADALRRVRDGGTVYIRARDGACHESVEINRPVVLIGDAYAGPGSQPSIAPRDGEPCVRVRPGTGRVELRDLVLDGGRGGRAACVQSWGADLGLVRVAIRYAGEGSSIFASHGKLTLNEVVIDHQSPDPAIGAEGAGVLAERVRIRTSSTGFDLDCGGPGGVHFDHVSAHAVRGPGEPKVGVVIRAGGHERVDLRHFRLAGFRTGVWLESGAQADLSTGHVVGADLGVVSEGGDLTLTDSAIGGRDVAVFVPSGRARIVHNRLFDFSVAPIDGEWRSEIVAGENWIYPEKGCGLFQSLFSRWCRGRGDFDRRWRRVDGWGDDFGFDGVAFDYPSGWSHEEPRRMEFGRHGLSPGVFAPPPHASYKPEFH